MRKIACQGPEITQYKPVFLKHAGESGGTMFKTRGVYIDCQDPYSHRVELFQSRGKSDTWTHH